MREISNMIANLTNEAPEVINKRVSKMLEELKVLAATKKKEECGRLKTERSCVNASSIYLHWSDTAVS
jgi:hypothetical protein